MRVALIGYGAVAAVHARGLATAPDDSLAAVIGPDPEKAQAFARAHGAATACTDIEEGMALADAVIVASPSALHFAQALSCLQERRHVLVELPAVQTPAEATELAGAAAASGCVLRCATTSRFLTPYRMIGGWLAEQRLGRVLAVQHWRTMAPRTRSWTDDALLHHGAHPIDLLMHWFGGLEPLGCAAVPGAVGAQQVALLARLPQGAPVSMAISYEGRLPAVGLTLVCEQHMLITDGFSRIQCDDTALCWRGDEDEEYAGAVARQDRAFLDACRLPGETGNWPEIERLAACIATFQQLGVAATVAGRGSGQSDGQRQA